MKQKGSIVIALENQLDIFYNIFKRCIYAQHFKPPVEQRPVGGSHTTQKMQNCC